MNVTMNFHQIESTPAIKEMVEKKSAKLKKFFNSGFDLKWTLSVEKGGHHSHAILAADGFTLNADSVKDDLYKTFPSEVTYREKLSMSQPSVGSAKIKLVNKINEKNNFNSLKLIIGNENIKLPFNC